MRPVLKWPVGTQGVVAEYDPYGTAKRKLGENLGDYCCYCDRQLDLIALEVEHILPKKKFPAHEFRWDNFLLACKSCNLVKEEKVLAGSDAILFPHLHNTYFAFTITGGAMIRPRAGLQPQEQALATKTISELGLNRKEGDPDHTPADDRVKYRRQALQLAQRYLRKFEVGEADEETIVSLAQFRGFWLVWMEVFAGHRAIQNALIAAFPGSYGHCRSGKLAR